MGAHMAQRGEGPDFIEALARGLDVIRIFHADRPRLPLSAVAEAAGLARPTARRILLNVTVNSAETSTKILTEQYLPHLLRAAGAISSDWALSQSRPSTTCRGPLWCLPGSEARC